MLRWQFGPADVGRISCPVMHFSGIDSGPWFAEVRNLMLEWFPHADDAVIEGADSLALTRSHAIVPAIATFMRDNPMGHDGN